MYVFKQGTSDIYTCEFVIKGKTIRRSTGKTMKREAEEEGIAIRKLMLARHQHGVTTPMPLIDAFKRYKETVIDRGTSDGKNYRLSSGRICDILGPGTILDDITDAMIADMRDGLLARGRRFVAKGNKWGVLSSSKTKGLKASSVNSYLKLLRTVLRCAYYDWKTLQRLPVIKLIKDQRDKLQNGKHRKPPRFLTIEEELQLMTASPFYLRQYLTFLLGTGARKSEAVMLTWDQVDNLDLDARPREVSPFGKPLDEKGQPYARVRFEHVPEDGRKTKGGKWRAVPLPEHVREMLVRMRKAQLERGYNGNRVFLGRDRGGRTWQEVPSMVSTFDTARRRAGLDAAKQGERITLHSMRHTYASRLVMEGIALDRVRDLMGHESIEQTELYAKLAPTTLVTAVAVLGKYVPRPQLRVAA